MVVFRPRGTIQVIISAFFILRASNMHYYKDRPSCCSLSATVLDPTTAETFAAWKLAEFSLNMGFRNIVVEGDSLEVSHVRKTGNVAAHRLARYALIKLYHRTSLAL